MVGCVLHVGDYREAHCRQCGRHFWNGEGGRCYKCSPNSEDDDETEYYLTI